jgi:mannose/cellobiose epimerase-like protein (N-acyl-D-glucosamine 2-epimerase family)
MPACTACGAPNAAHHHLAEADAAVGRARADKWAQRVEDGETREVSVRLPPEAFTWICDACLPAYETAHPEFARERAERVAFQAFVRTLPPDVAPEEAIRRYRARGAGDDAPPA